MKRTAFVTTWLVLAACSGALAAVGGGEVTLKVKGAKNVAFSHETHVNGVALECTECHSKLYTNAAGHKHTSMKQMKEGKSCGACHNGKQAFSVKGDCAKCHNQ